LDCKKYQTDSVDKHSCGLNIYAESLSSISRSCGSSRSAISVAANLVTVSLGTENDGSILCPSNANSVVGIKPTVGLTSRAGVIPISLRQDTVGCVILCYSYQLNYDI